MVRLSYTVGQMERVPRGYAVAWWSDTALTAVCLPMGLHLAVGALRAAWLWLKVSRVPTVLDGAVRRGWDHGFEAGKLAGASEERQRFVGERAQIEHDAIHRFLVQLMIRPASEEDGDAVTKH